MINVNCKSEVYIAGFCDVSAESQAKKSRRKGRDGGVLGVGLAEKLKGEGIKNPAQWPDVFIRRGGLFVLVDSAVFLHAQFRMWFLWYHQSCIGLPLGQQATYRL